MPSRLATILFCVVGSACAANTANPTACQRASGHFTMYPVGESNCDLFRNLLVDVGAASSLQGTEEDVCWIDIETDVLFADGYNLELRDSSVPLTIGDDDDLRVLLPTSTDVTLDYDFSDFQWREEKELSLEIAVIQIGGGLAELHGYSVLSCGFVSE